jgi:deoxycytidylate deaminase
VRNGYYKLASLVVIGKQVFFGVNHNKTHPNLMMVGRDNEKVFSSIHAEMDALLKAKRMLGEEQFKKNAKKMKLYVLRVKKNGSIGLAKPCKHCQKHLFEAGLLPKNIYYTTNNGKWENMK